MARRWAETARDIRPSQRGLELSTAAEGAEKRTGEAEKTTEEEAEVREVSRKVTEAAGTTEQTRKPEATGTQEVSRRMSLEGSLETSRKWSLLEVSRFPTQEIP